MRFFFLVFVLCGLSFSSASAKEVIHDFHTRIDIQDNGGIIVTETIKFTAEGKQIKRGLYRDLPLYRRTFLGGVIPTDFQIISLTRDGTPEPYHIEDNDMGSLRIYFGESGYFLPTGKAYTYVFRYSAPAQVYAYEDMDEINWNVIGTNWQFPIINGSAEVILPRGATLGSAVAYTGKALSKDQDYAVAKPHGRVYFDVTRILEPGEGLTVAVSWSKGYVHHADYMTGLSFFWHQHPGLIPLIIAFLCMAMYYYYVWIRVGKDPKKRALTPFYTPPKDISPAMAAYIQSMGSAGKRKCMTAAIISLASKGHIEIIETKKNKYKINRLHGITKRQKLSEDEKILYDAIGQSMTLSAHNKTLIKASSEHQKTLSRICKKVYFHINFKWWAAGIIPLTLACVYIAIFKMVPPDFWFFSLFILVFGGISLPVFIYALKSVFTAPITQKVTAIFLLIWSMGFSIGGFVGLYFLSMVASWLVIGLMVLILVFIGIMYPIMKAPTRKGQDIIDHINGLQYYMEMVEEKVLQKFDPPQMSRELYEKYLPYAVALDVESKWADKFASAMASSPMSSQGNVNTAPRWYHTSLGSSTLSSGAFSAGTMVGALGSALSSASTSRSSSGGGSSGGGGGGGGGGGW